MNLFREKKNLCCAVSAQVRKTDRSELGKFTDVH